MSEEEKVDLMPEELQKVLLEEAEEKVASFTWMNKANALKPNTVY